MTDRDAQQPFRHVIYTRLAVRPEADTPIDPKWLESRKALLDQFCLASLKIQNDLHFEWVLLASSTEISQCDELLLSLDVGSVRWSLLEVPDLGQLASSIRAHVETMDLADSDVVVTTRLDSDDALHQSYVERVNQWVRNGGRGVFEPRHGLSLLVGETSRLADIVKVTPPFLSTTFQPSGLRLTCHDVEHTRWSDSIATPMEQGPPTPLWCQVVHGSNLANTFAWGWAVSSVKERRSFAVLHEFGVAVPAGSASASTIRFRNLGHQLRGVRLRFVDWLSRRLHARR